MKAKYLLILLILLPIGLFAQPVTDLADLNIKGKVKYLTEDFYTVEEANDREEEIPDFTRYYRRILFNEKGNKTREEWYVTNQGTRPNDASRYLHSYWTFHYNNKGNIDTCSWFNYDGELKQRWTYSYNNKGKETDVLLYDKSFDLTIHYKHTLNAAGQIEETVIPRSRKDYTQPTYRYYYDKKGNRVKEETGYTQINEDIDDGDGAKKEHQEQWVPEWTCIYTYDENNRLASKSGDGEYDTDSFYKYDTKGRLIETKHSVFDDFGYNLTTYTYDNQGNVLKMNTDVIRDEDFNVTPNFFITSTKTETNSTYVYDYEKIEGGWNWYRRTETTNGKKMITYRQFEYYED